MKEWREQDHHRATCWKFPIPSLKKHKTLKSQYHRQIYCNRKASKSLLKHKSYFVSRNLHRRRLKNGSFKRIWTKELAQNAKHKQQNFFANKKPLDSDFLSVTSYWVLDSLVKCVCVLIDRLKSIERSKFWSRVRWKIAMFKLFLMKPKYCGK